MSEEQLAQAQKIAECVAGCTQNNIQNPSAIQPCIAGCQPGNGAQGIEVYAHLSLFNLN